MSWTLFHKVGGLLLFYGPDTVALYARALERLQAWLGLADGGPWSPLLLLWAAHFLGGGLAAVIGLRAARGPGGPVEDGFLGGFAPRPPREDPARRDFSLTALALHVIFIAAAMSLGAKLPLWGFALAAALYAAVCLPAYPRALSVMRRVGLWSGTLGVCALAGLILGSWQAGAQMGLRAALLTLGFSCVGEELRNPALRSWLERHGGRVFFEALEQAFDALPAVLDGLPGGARLLRSPVESLRAAIKRAPALLDRLAQGRVFIIAAGQGAGKSSLVAGLAEGLRRSGASVGGLHAPGFWEAGRLAGFDIVDLRTGERRLLCRKDRRGGPALGAFRFSPDGISFGLKVLAEARRLDVDVLMVDEVGPLELRGEGWAPELERLARERRKPMVWVVREGLVEDVRRRWGLAQSRLWGADAGRLEALLGELLPEPF